MSIEVELAAPSFLIAVPQLGDPNFWRSVVFMLEHSEEGSMGLVITQASELTVDSFCEAQGIKYEGDGNQPVYVGGPVQTGRAFVLHSSEISGPETESVVDNLDLSYSLETLRLLAAAPPEDLRVYLGYAGWGPGQLADEISEGAWLVAPATPELVFAGDIGATWEAALRRLGIEPAQLMHSGAVH